MMVKGVVAVTCAETSRAGSISQREPEGDAGSGTGRNALGRTSELIEAFTGDWSDSRCGLKPGPMESMAMMICGAFGAGAAPDPVGQVRLRLEGDAAYADLRGPTACEVLTPDQVEALAARIGPDPIRRDADPERAWRRVSRSNAPIGTLLMDQAVFAGVGNIYRAEALYRAGIDPYRAGRDVSREEFLDMWSDLVVLMRDGVRRGRIDTVREEHTPRAMGRPRRRDRHGGEVYVYRREGRDCLVCGDEIAWADMAGRNLYWCPTCQAH